MRFAVPVRRLCMGHRKLVSNDFNELIDHYSKFNPSPLSIKQFVEFGERANPADSFAFLRKEVPVRLANIMKEIELLPPQLLEMPSVKTVASWYQRSFMEIAEFDRLTKGTPTDSELKNFTDTLTKVRNRHNDVVQTMAEGVLEMKRQQKSDVSTEYTIQYFLDRFYMSRISIRMLINQHTSLFGSQKQPSGNGRQVGVIDPHCDITSVCLDAFENAKFLCDRYYLTSPNMIQECIPKEPRIRIVYVPCHLYHILFELFKNAMRAVVEHHGADANYLPELRVLIVQGKEDITIRLSDLGGGIPRTASDLLFQYMYSTAPEPCSTNSAPLAGYGYGLPISRLYARYLHGDLTVTSMGGYGTDAHVYIKAISKDSHEMLPIFNKTTSKHYNMVIGSNDWSSPLSADWVNCDSDTWLLYKIEKTLEDSNATKAHIYLVVGNVDGKLSKGTFIEGGYARNEEASKLVYSAQDMSHYDAFFYYGRPEETVVLVVRETASVGPSRCTHPIRRSSSTESLTSSVLSDSQLSEEDFDPGDVEELMEIAGTSAPFNADVTSDSEEELNFCNEKALGSYGEEEMYFFSEEEVYSFSEEETYSFSEEEMYSFSEENMDFDGVEEENFVRTEEIKVTSLEESMEPPNAADEAPSLHSEDGGASLFYFDEFESVIIGANETVSY